MVKTGGNGGFGGGGGGEGGAKEEEDLASPDLELATEVEESISSILHKNLFDCPINEK